MTDFKTWILSVPQEKNSIWEIILWWEYRRIPYNIIVGVSSFISLLFFYLFISLSHELKPGEDAIEPLVLLAAPILINICYTFGWVVESFARLLIGRSYKRISRGLFLTGFVFSLAIISIPSVLWAIIWFHRIIH